MIPLTEERIAIIQNKCPNCGAKLEYKKGVGSNPDFLGCPRHIFCHFKGYSANSAIFLLQHYCEELSKELSALKDGKEQITANHIQFCKDSPFRRENLLLFFRLLHRKPKKA